MGINRLIEVLAKKEEIEIYYDYLLGQEVWYFLNNGDDFSSDYDQFKRFISKNLSIPFNNISIVGSAKTRFSFAPKKNLKEFDNESDFDLILVSRDLFNKFWITFRRIAQNQRLQYYDSKCRDVFRGFVSIRDTDRTYGNKELESWQRKVHTFKAELQLTFNIQHEINYRIYSDWDSVESYHLKGITALKNIINEAY